MEKFIYKNIYEKILRIKKSDTARVRNKYYHKTTRNAIRDLRNEKDKKKAENTFEHIAFDFHF